MKRFLFIVCCCMAAGVVVFMLIQAPQWFRNHDWTGDIIYVVAIVGWCFITYNIANKKYKWTQKFFK